jgi:hypothetical protein
LVDFHCDFTYRKAAIRQIKSRVRAVLGERRIVLAKAAWGTAGSLETRPAVPSRDGSVFSGTKPEFVTELEMVDWIDSA